MGKTYFFNFSASSIIACLVFSSRCSIVFTKERYFWKDAVAAFCGSNVRASIKTLFSDGSYATENYMETLDGEEISLTISDYDLHPLPKETQTSYNETCSQISVCTRTKTHRILVGTSFSGILTEDTISGTFSGEFSGFCVFKKV